MGPVLEVNANLQSAKTKQTHTLILLMVFFFHTQACMSLHPAVLEGEQV